MTSDIVTRVRKADGKATLQATLPRSMAGTIRIIFARN